MFIGVVSTGRSVNVHCVNWIVKSFLACTATAGMFLCT